MYVYVITRDGTIPSVETVLSSKAKAELYVMENSPDEYDHDCWWDRHEVV